MKTEKHNNQLKIQTPPIHTKLFLPPREIYTYKYT